MTYTRRIVCLANSRKPGGRCVAGLEVGESGVGPWIRPVSNRPSEELSFGERRVKSGQEVQLLDIVEIAFLEHRPHSCQVENHVIDDTQDWQLRGTFERNDLMGHATEGGPLWLDTSSSGGGLNDRILVADADRLDHSLKLIRPTDLRIRVVRPYERIQIRAAFRLEHHEYNLVVTDPEIEARYRRKAIGEYPYPSDAVGCISLGEPYKDGYRYKLVASLIDLT